MSSSEKSTDVPFAADGGLDAPMAPPSDPFQALDELMAVVEELCPVWPPRDTFKNESQNRL
jgi:hypothetical protein